MGTLVVPLVTVVMPARGPTAFLPLALKSALLQRDVDLEVVVVEDGSETGIAGFPNGFDDRRVRMIRLDRPQGVSAARNAGALVSGSEWIAFLDDDDLWAPDKLSRQLSEALHLNRDWVYANAVGIDTENRVLHVERLLGPEALLERLPHLNVVPAGASNVLVRRRVLSDAGLFDVALRLTEDWDLFIRLARQGPPACVADPLVAFRIHPRQSSLDVSGLLAELERFERRHHVSTDKAAILRGAAWACLRAGRRRAAFLAYLQAVRQGDITSVGRAAAALLPRAGRNRVLERATGRVEEEDRSRAQRWLDAVVGSP